MNVPAGGGGWDELRSTYKLIIQREDDYSFPPCPHFLPDTQQQQGDIMKEHEGRRREGTVVAEE
jgi:hypothetical protein